jgi:uncharacterized membrane protein YkvI
MKTRKIVLDLIDFIFTIIGLVLFILFIIKLIQYAIPQQKASQDTVQRR